MNGSRWAPVLGALLVVSGCGGGDDAANEGLLELRPVLGAETPPCPRAPDDSDDQGETVVVPERREGRTVSCLRLGSPIVTASDVRSASLSDDADPDGPVVNVVLGRVGGRNLDAFAERSQGKRLAIVVNDRLVSAPTVAGSGFIGRLAITGLPKEEAVGLFERLREGPAPS